MKTLMYWEGPKPPMIQRCIKTIESRNDVEWIDPKIVADLEGKPKWLKADIARLRAIMQQDEPVYWCDADCIALKPFDYWDDKYDVIGFGSDNMPTFATSVFAAKPGELMERILYEAERADDTFGAKGQLIFSRHWRSNPRKMLKLSRMNFAPVPWNKVHELFGPYHEQRFAPNAYCYHLTNKVVAENKVPPKSLLHHIFAVAEGWTFNKRSHVLAQLIPKNGIGVELGVFEAQNASDLLAVRPDIYLHCIDAWKQLNHPHYAASGDAKAKINNKKWEVHFTRAVNRLAHFRDRCHITRGLTWQSASLFNDESLDFIYIDADHSYEGCKKDIQAWLPKMKPGALLCGHDYSKKQWPGVVKAVNELLGPPEKLFGINWVHYKK